MAERKSGKTGTQQSAKRTTGKASKGFTDEERGAMRERARELKASARSGAGKADGESDVRLQRQGEPRRRLHVADLLRAQGVEQRRRAQDRRAGEESGELRTEAL